MGELMEAKPRELSFGQQVRSDVIRSQVAAAIGTAMDADQFIQHAIIAFQDPKVAGCSTHSKTVALMEMAALALLPTLRQCVLIPYKDQVKVMPQWQGYKAVMERHPSVLELDAFLVHRLDAIDVTENGVEHRMNPFAAERMFASIADIVGGYLRVRYRDGRPPKYHFVSAAHIEKCRNCAQTQEVWGKWFEQMALKTVYRDAYARRVVPIDPLVIERMEKLVSADDIVLGNDPARIASAGAQGETKAENISSRMKARRGKAPAAPAAEQEPPSPPVAEEAAGPPDIAAVSLLLEEFRDEIERADTPAALDHLAKLAVGSEELGPAGRQTVDGWIAERRKAMGGKRSLFKE